MFYVRKFNLLYIFSGGEGGLSFGVLLFFDLVVVLFLLFVREVCDLLFGNFNYMKEKW